MLSLAKYINSHIEPYPPVGGVDVLSREVSTSTHSHISWESRFDELQVRGLETAATIIRSVIRLKTPNFSFRRTS